MANANNYAAARGCNERCGARERSGRCDAPTVRMAASHTYVSDGTAAACCCKVFTRMLCINTSFIYVIYSNVAHLAPQPRPRCPCPGKLCHLHNLLGCSRAGAAAGGTGERFILKQFKIFSCNYMSTSRKSRQDNDNSAARLFIGKHTQNKHKYKYVYVYSYAYAYAHCCNWQIQAQRTRLCIWIFAYRTSYLHIASFELGTRQNE